MTCAMRICGIFTLQYHLDIALDSLQCFSNGPLHNASIFHPEVAYLAILLLYYPFNHAIFVLQLVENTVCFTICMIQH